LCLSLTPVRVTKKYHCLNKAMLASALFVLIAVALADEARISFQGGSVSNRGVTLELIKDGEAIIEAERKIHELEEFRATKTAVEAHLSVTDLDRLALHVAKEERLVKEGERIIVKLEKLRASKVALELNSHILAQRNAARLRLEEEYVPTPQHQPSPGNPRTLPDHAFLKGDPGTEAAYHFKMCGEVRSKVHDARIANRSESHILQATAFAHCERAIELRPSFYEALEYAASLAQSLGGGGVLTTAARYRRRASALGRHVFFPAPLQPPSDRQLGSITGSAAGLANIAAFYDGGSQTLIDVDLSLARTLFFWHDSKNPDQGAFETFTADKIRHDIA
jgi:hypothetical protein